MMCHKQTIRLFENKKQHRLLPACRTDTKGALLYGVTGMCACVITFRGTTSLAPLDGYPFMTKGKKTAWKKAVFLRQSPAGGAAFWDGSLFWGGRFLTIFSGICANCLTFGGGLWYIDHTKWVSYLCSCLRDRQFAAKTANFLCKKKRNRFQKVDNASSVPIGRACERGGKPWPKQPNPLSTTS